MLSYIVAGAVIASILKAFGVGLLASVFLPAALLWLAWIIAMPRCGRTILSKADSSVWECNRPAFHSGRHVSDVAIRNGLAIRKVFRYNRFGEPCVRTKSVNGLRAKLARRRLAARSQS